MSRPDRPLDAYHDVIRHLAWLAHSDNMERSAEELAREGKQPTGRAVDDRARSYAFASKLEEIAADTDPGKFSTARPSDYVSAAIDLLDLALADMPEHASPRAAADEIRKARDILLRRRQLLRRRFA